MANKGSFAQRMASIASTIENWDDDGDFDAQGDLFAHSMSTIQSTTSSRVSVRSESNTGDDDWQVLLTPNDELSTLNAITSAKHAGIPIPTSVPSSALLGGSIKRLGKKKSNRKIAVVDDWGDDLELPANATDGGLKLKLQPPRTPADDQDDLDDWGEGSLGIRFGGTRREVRGGRSSSASAMSPSMNSCMTLESEDDDLTGLVLPLPHEPLDFSARLERLKKAEQQTPDISPLPHHRREPPPTSAPTLAPAAEFASPPPPVQTSSTHPLERELWPESKPKPVLDEEDFLDGLDFGSGEALDTQKITLNRNVVVKKPSSKKVGAPAAARAATTLTFTDKPTASRIPRPLPSSASRTRLTPLYESGAPAQASSRPMPTTTSAQLLRAKRSAPVLRNNYGSLSRAPVPFLPAGTSNAQSHHIMSRNPQQHLRRDSDPRRPQSPSMRSYSRGSNQPETPSRTSMRRDVAPTARQPLIPRRIVQPQGPKKVYGDGNELEGFDDLPTSATKEKQFEKVPRNAPSNKSLRHQTSIARIPLPDRMTTPLPQTPRSPSKTESTPRFARDTAASRIAREQRLAGTRSRGEGPIVPTHTNWKAQVAARSPHASPTTHRKRGSFQKPTLIKAMSVPVPKNEKGMIYNPALNRWEGNEEALAPFSHPNTSTTTLALTTASTPTFAPSGHQHHFSYSHDRSQSISHIALSSIQNAQRNITSRAVKLIPAPVPSPPRPALISQISVPRGVQYEGRMFFDPVKMCWLKNPRVAHDPLSPSIDQDDDEDPFAGIEDFKEDQSTTGGIGNSNGSTPKADDPSFVGEEFDLGPSFIRRQREEENIWRRRTECWVDGMRDNGEDKENGWRWAIRKLVSEATLANNQ
ncbi:hypothetical protein K504DRAFT_429157 [Pleomassaria siparia CBS 279.74]|uniref:Cytokinesis regulator n=1 Tax=Pleomassaria siparia CBS 279.74 TaxID=1314801 RepID=A0A6G1KDG8_9PLEO|nr:hypothetical protein K504DRAFT_429157 [Pleomassaria siparia CBS 279.74]